jgi:hypothetical protein
MAPCPRSPVKLCGKQPPRLTAVDIPERYVRLCLRVGRHIEDFVDAYIGPSGWERSVAAEEPADPRHLRDEARLLLDGLADADLEEDRRRWLRGQLDAIGCITTRLTGGDMAWTDEVERCLGVRPTRTDTRVFEDVHRRLDAALPGSGTVREGYNAWDEANAIPREKLVPALERLKEVLGPRAHALARMPAEESVTYELVSNEPWIAYNRYEGQHRSRIEVNADLPISVVLLVDLAAHEAYPGHHTERSAKESHLYRELGRLETSVVITPAPESVVSEGIALNALEEALGPKPFDVVGDVLADLDLRFDPIEAHEVHLAEKALYATGTNAAFMLHEDGATAEEAEGYVREWGLESDEKAARTVAFLTDPSSRAYVSAYPDGGRLCRDFAERASGNFTRLLTEQLSSADLLF